MKSVICSADQQGLFRVSPHCKNMIPLPDMAPNRAAHLGYQLASSPLKLLPASPSCSVNCNAFGSISHNRGQCRAQWLMATIHIKASFKALPCQQHTALNQTKLTLGLVTVTLFLWTHNVTQIFWVNMQNWVYLLSNWMLLFLFWTIHQWTVYKIVFLVTLYNKVH